MPRGQCHCGAVSYEVSGAPIHNALCHCTDCRRHAGAPLVAWAMFPADQVGIEGTPNVYISSAHGRRHFCGACGTSLFYTNETLLPGMVDVQIATLDDPDLLPPTAHIQCADAIGWTADMASLPRFDRFPSQG